MRSRVCHFSDLPEDVQILVSDFVEDSLGMRGFERLGLHSFQIHCLPVAAFPSVRMWTDYRDRGYSEAMIGQQVPPVLICDDHWLDGRNRVWAARQSGKTAVDCIDLAEIGVRIRFEQLGRLIPVEHERGTDETQNGLCLSALHHRAFDHGLIGVKRNYRIIFHEEHFTKLRAIGWEGGEKTFRDGCRDAINLPARREFYPDPDYLVFGQVLRGWNARHLS
jgi:hypothetical protein